MKLKSKPNHLKHHRMKDATPRLPTIALNAHTEEHTQTFTDDNKLVLIQSKGKKIKNNPKYKQPINKFLKLLVTIIHTLKQSHHKYCKVFYLTRTLKGLQTSLAITLSNTTMFMRGRRWKFQADSENSYS